ncbi:MAG: TetR/AcrR family transcriptional regulator [Eubacterium sp.]|nr:TetR/AcrR family transcriptional regulator [Candidatus Colimonas fimequi]
MNTNLSRKRDYIRITGEILNNEGREGISIRRIANEAGCSSAVLYKHFQNLDHLIKLASVQFLEPYMHQMSIESARGELTPIQLNLILWKRFLDEAFKKKDYYEMMFISTDKDILKSCVEEYYRIFSEELDEVDPISENILFSNSLQEREYTRLKQAAEQGLIGEQEAYDLSVLGEAIFAGRLTQFDDGEDPVKAADECYGLIFSLYTKYVNPETKLDI